MPSTTRIIIDYVTGDSWEVPIPLYEKYVNESPNLQANSKTVVELWLESLTTEEMEKVRKQ